MAIKSDVKRAYGFKNLHIAILKKNEEGGIEYDEPVFVKGVENFQYTPQYAEGEAYSDDKQDTVVRMPVAYELSLTLAQYLSKIQKIIEGSSTENGGVTVNTEDSQNAFAVLFEFDYSDGDKGFGIFYNCKLSKESFTHNTKTTNIDFSKHQFKGKAIPVADGTLCRFFSKNEGKLKPDVITNFYKKVLGTKEKILTD